MTRSQRLVALIVLVAGLHARAALAHHSVSAWFDTTATGGGRKAWSPIFAGRTRTSSSLCASPCDGGRRAPLEIETLSISGISRWGITHDLFSVGDRLRVAGNPARRGENNQFFVRNILLPSGREIVLG